MTFLLQVKYFSVVDINYLSKIIFAKSNCPFIHLFKLCINIHVKNYDYQHKIKQCLTICKNQGVIPKIKMFMRSKTFSVFFLQYFIQPCFCQISTYVANSNFTLLTLRQIIILFTLVANELCS